MIYKGYIFSLTWRVGFLVTAIILFAFGLAQSQPYMIAVGSILSVISIYNIYKFVIRRFLEMDDFFQSIKYRDFSRHFVETKGSQDIRTLHTGFNLVNSTIKSINSERQAQFLYLQKILEMVEVGIIAYNVETGEVMWCNDSMLETLDFPLFKNISFVETRKPSVYSELFETYHSTTTTTQLKVGQELIKVLITDTVFNLDDNSFKLIVLQNIDRPLNQNESDSWKKLLSVMTHEIMNSIAPISSLAETLEDHIKQDLENQETTIDKADLLAGIGSIKNRSLGLMQFAKTYRSLNKVTQVNKSLTTVADLFENIHNLLLPTIIDKGVLVEFDVSKSLQLLIDHHLIEQVLINLVLNAMEAVEAVEGGKIKVSAFKTPRGNINVVVIDNGTGVPDEIKENIFIPFYSTKNRGSGVGLSLCKQIMTLHQGKIQVEDAPEGGALFRLVFPQ
ncbi:MAG: HAMP domain-containing sensor histidine kinase [Nonlabens sp.]